MNELMDDCERCEHFERCYYCPTDDNANAAMDVKKSITSLGGRDLCINNGKKFFEIKSNPK